MPPTCQQIVDDIRNDRESGAAELVGRALDALACFGALSLQPSTDADAALRRLVREIHEVRPSMGAIGVQALLVYARAAQQVRQGRGSLGEAVVESVSFYRKALLHAHERIAEVGMTTLGTGRRIATCSFSSTLMPLFSLSRPAAVFIGDGAPLGDGLKAAAQMAELRISVTVVPDSAVASVVDKVDMVVIGADQVLSNGAVVNRTGSLPLALSADHFGIPVYVACQKLKVSGIDQRDLVLEMLPPELLSHPASTLSHAALFEVIPAALITRIFTEEGPLEAMDIDDISRKLSFLRRKLILCG